MHEVYIVNDDLTIEKKYMHEVAEDKNLMEMVTSPRCAESRYSIEEVISIVDDDDVVFWTHYNNNLSYFQNVICDKMGEKVEDCISDFSQGIKCLKAFETDKFKFEFNIVRSKALLRWDNSSQKLIQIFHDAEEARNAWIEILEEVFIENASNQGIMWFDDEHEAVGFVAEQKEEDNE